MGSLTHQNAIKGEKSVCSDSPTVMQAVSGRNEMQSGLRESSAQPSTSTRPFLFPFQQLSLPSAVAATVVVLGYLKHCCCTLTAPHARAFPCIQPASPGLCSHGQRPDRLQSELCLSQGPEPDPRQCLSCTRALPGRRIIRLTVATYTITINPLRD